jgi:ribosome-binding protein aMBF1 (putative translation factor)
MLDKTKALSSLIAAFGCQAKLAAEINRKQNIISCWLNGKPIPMKKAIELEKIAKNKGVEGITAKTLTPELDWGN